MSDRFPPHVLEALERMREDLPADEVAALMVALEQVQRNENTTLAELLTDLFRRLGHSEAAAAEAAEAAIAAGPPDLRAKLN